MAALSANGRRAGVLRHAVVVLAAGLLAAGALAACGPVEAPPREPPPEAATLDDEALAAADLARGEQLSLACQACHALDAARTSPLGPNLAGVFGRRAGSVPGFEYSPAFEGAAFVWSVDALDRWLADPTGFLPGTTMAFTGYRSANDRRDLIAYLLAATGAGLPPRVGHED